MTVRTRIGCGLLAAAIGCSFFPTVATAADCGLPGSAGTGMSEITVRMASPDDGRRGRQMTHARRRRSSAVHAM